jgi:hypothetical protein
VAWTDERLDDLASRMDAGFELVDRDIRDLRVEVRALGGDVRSEMRSEAGGLRGEIAGLGVELRSEIAGLGVELRSEIAGLGVELRSEIAELRSTMNRFGIAIIVVLFGAIAAQVFG